MEPVIIALGSNVGDRLQHMLNARQFLSELSAKPIHPSPLYLTEPVGISNRYFLNGVIKITTPHPPEELLVKLKKYERRHGRPTRHPRWNPRTIDLDIISFGNLVIQNDTLIIPHPEYHKRLFVLKPLQDICPDWLDPKTGSDIDTLIAEAAELPMKQLNRSWQHGK